MNKVKVNEKTKNDEVYYKLTFEQYSCPTERFPLLGIESEIPGNNCTLLDISSSDTALINDYLVDESSQDATFHCDDWPEGEQYFHIRVSIGIQMRFCQKRTKMRAQIHTQKIEELTA